MDWRIIVLLIRFILLFGQSANGTSSWSSLDLSDVSDEDQPISANTLIPSRKYCRRIQHLLNQNRDDSHFCNAVESLKRTLKMDAERRHSQLGSRNVKAIQDFRKTMRLNPNLPIIFYKYFCELLLEDGKCNEASLVLKRLTERGVPEDEKSQLEEIFKKVEEARKKQPVRPPEEAAKNEFSELFEQLMPIPANVTDFTTGEKILSLNGKGKSKIPSTNQGDQSGNSQNTDKRNQEDSPTNLSRTLLAIRNEGEMDSNTNPQPQERNTEKPNVSRDDPIEDTAAPLRKIKQHARINKLLMRHSHNLAQGKVSNNPTPIQDPSTSRKRMNFEINTNPKKKHIIERGAAKYPRNEKSNNAENTSSPRPSAPDDVTPTVPVDFQRDDYEWIAKTWIRELKNTSTVAEIICVKKAIFEVLFEAQLGSLHRNFINSFRSTTPTKNINTTGVFHTQLEDLELTQQIWVRELRNIANPTQVLFAKKVVSDIFFEAQMGALHKTSVLINRTPIKND